ncbi:MAG TPA: NAD(P)H-hydrate dehydratase [Rhabdochlamydiaceae bacterium]|jgi:NAD(P)H-hydrate epimerase
MLESLKIVTAKEMARIEALACSGGASEQTFMENAARSMAEHIVDWVEDHNLEKKVTILAGKGNKGGDAFATGSLLLEKKFSVDAWHIYPESACSPLCKKMRERFEKKGGKVRAAAWDFHPEGIILDGLVGTGFKGKAEDILAAAIDKANQSRLPIISIDIPSGVNGNTGEVGSVAVKAKATIYLELPKLGFFIDKGWDHIGTLVRGVFGLDNKYVESAAASAYLFDTESIPDLLPPLVRTRHKYQAGYVLAFAGSKEMPGAAILSSFSALRSGAGIARLFHPSGMEAELSHAPYELIKEEWNGKSLLRIHEESQRAKSLLLGPGMGRTKAAEQKIKKLLSAIALPCVIDADALYFIARNPKWALPKNSILTPHQGEMQMLLSHFSTKEEDPVQAYVNSKQVTLILKGAPTRIYHPRTKPLIVPHGDPGMATAGSGDVLTGVIAALLAQGLEIRTAACLAVALHAIAGEIAAAELTSYCMTASDIMECLPAAFHSFVPL